ncbi:MAG: hypothetical protein E6G94_09180 [Alphaproteobacteria bacterium]|nr:MAG: hypothetical protein E6G94_09180 [Alphaproteobacteria bacterium]
MGEGTEAAPSDVELQFELDEHGRVWIIRDGDCDIIGRKDAVCAEMRRFLAAAEVGAVDWGGHS